MSKVFIVGAETVSVPAEGTPLSDANASRFQSLITSLSFELGALYHAGYMTALGCASDSSLLLFFNNAGPFLTPTAPTAITQIHPTLTVATAAAISTYAPDMIIDVTGGIAPSASLLAAIATLRASAVAAGIIWRDLNSVPSPSVSLSAYYKAPLASAVATVHGRCLGYLAMPATVQYSIDGATTLTAAVSAAGTFSIPVARLAIGTARAVAVSDPAYPAIAASAAIPF